MQSESFRYMLHPVLAPSERCAHGTQLKMAVMAIAVHHARLECRFDAAHMETTQSATFCDTPEASQDLRMSKTHPSFRALHPQVIPENI